VERIVGQAGFVEAQMKVITALLGRVNYGIQTLWTRFFQIASFLAEEADVGYWLSHT